MTCNDPSCPRYGWCHHAPDCPERTSIAQQNHTARRNERGQPRVFAHGHVAKLHPPPGRGIPYSRIGAPARHIRPELEFLIRLYGTKRAVAAKLGVSPAWVTNIGNGVIRRVRLSMAQRICVLARGRRDQLPEPETLRNRTDKRRERAGLTNSKRCACGRRVLSDWYDRCYECRRRTA